MRMALPPDLTVEVKRSTSRSDSHPDLGRLALLPSTVSRVLSRAGRRCVCRSLQVFRLAWAERCPGRRERLASGRVCRGASGRDGHPTGCGGLVPADEGPAARDGKAEGGCVHSRLEPRRPPVLLVLGLSDQTGSYASDPSNSPDPQPPPDERRLLSACSQVWRSERSRITRGVFVT